jgi:hypothetical protein
MIDVTKFVLAKSVQYNPIMKIHLFALKIFGYMLFDDQNLLRLHCLRGVIFTVSFIIFNVTQVRLLI